MTEPVLMFFNVKPHARGKCTAESVQTAQEVEYL